MVREEMGLFDRKTPLHAILPASLVRAAGKE
jgi:hypothetical protein